MARAALQKNVDAEDIIALPVKEKIGRAKYIPEEQTDSFKIISDEMERQFAQLIG